MAWALPQVLWALLLLPLILLLPARKPSTALWVANVVSEQKSTPKNWLNKALLMLMFAAVIVALAQPEQLGEPIQVTSSQRDMVLSIDLSGSMRERDMRFEQGIYRRIDVVKQVVREFVAQRQGDRIGIVFFADNAYVQAPITGDLTTVMQWIDEAVPYLVGSETAVGEGIVLAARQLRALDAEEKVMILLSDGTNNAGEVEPIEAAQWAASQGIKIYTIGVNGFWREADNRTLAGVAQITDGKFYDAQDAYDLFAIYGEIDRLEPIERLTDPLRINLPLYPWPLGLALATFAALMLLRGRQL